MIARKIVTELPEGLKEGSEVYLKLDNTTYVKYIANESRDWMPVKGYLELSGLLSDSGFDVYRNEFGVQVQFEKINSGEYKLTFDEQLAEKDYRPFQFFASVDGDETFFNGYAEYREDNNEVNILLLDDNLSGYQIVDGIPVTLKVYPT